MLSPLELENKRILTSKRKYDRFEMDEYLDMVFENYKTLYAAYEEQKKQIKTLTDGIQYYRSIESTMQKALVLAEKTSKETKDAAMLKAESIEKEALGKADRIIGEAENEYNRIREKCIALVQQFNNYKAQLQIAAKEQLRLITSATFDVDTPDSFDQAPYESSMTPEQLSAMAEQQIAFPDQEYQNQGYDIGAEPVTPIDSIIQSDNTYQTEPDENEKSSVYSFSGDTQPLPDISSMVSPGAEPAYPQGDEPGIPIENNVIPDDQSPIVSGTINLSADEPETDVSSDFEMYSEPYPAEEQPVSSGVQEQPVVQLEPAASEPPVVQLEPAESEPPMIRLEPEPAKQPELRLEPDAAGQGVPDKTMVLPDVTGIERTARRAVRQAMNEEDALSLMNAETINLGDSIKEVRTREESLQVPDKQEELPTIQLEPGPQAPQPTVQRAPQGLDSILQNMSIGKKKKANGVTDEDPFEFLGSVDDF